MESVDRQFRQLKENYEHMTEDELCAVAENAYDLTEIAREALQAVITERGFTVPLKLDPPSHSSHSSTDPPDEDLVVFGWAKSAEEAGRTMKILAAAGIPSYLSLEIRASDMQRAEAALERAIDDEIGEEPEEEKPYAILCPKCHSAKVVLEGRYSVRSDHEFPGKFQWRCDACGHLWEDEGIVQEADGGQSWPGEEFPSHDEDSSEERDPK